MELDPVMIDPASIHILTRGIVMSLKGPKKIFAILAAVLAILVLSVWAVFHLFFTPWIKKKAETYVENNTDYNLAIGTIALTGFQGLTITSVKFEPKLDIKEFNKKNGIEKDWISVKAERISLSGINWGALIFDDKVYINELAVAGPDIYVYRDKTLPDSSVYKPLPSVLLRGTKRSITIPAIVITNGKVMYEERPEKGTRPGKIWFNNIGAAINHVSTDGEYIARQPDVTLSADARFMDSAEVSIEYSANTMEKNGKFFMEGKVSSMSATILNQCVVPLANVKVESGFISRISFHFTGDDDLATGEMDMDYSHLRVSIPAADKKGKSKLKTFFANIFIADMDKEPGKKENKKKGEIRFERRKDKFVFNYWWNAFKSGVITTITAIEAEDIPKK